MIELLPADLIFSRSKNLLGKMIRWFERARGEPQSYTNHVAGIGTAGNVVEAMLTVQSTVYWRWAEEEPAFQIWRTSDLDNAGRIAVAQYAESQVGRKYGAMKLIPHAMDGLISKVVGGSPYVFRRFMFMKRYPICSWEWSYAYHEAGLDFGSSPKKMSPDDMHDFCLGHPAKWEMVFEKTA